MLKTRQILAVKAVIVVDQIGHCYFPVTKIKGSFVTTSLDVNHHIHFCTLALYRKEWGWGLVGRMVAS